MSVRASGFLSRKGSVMPNVSFLTGRQSKTGFYSPTDWANGADDSLQGSEMLTGKQKISLPFTLSKSVAFLCVGDLIPHSYLPLSFMPSTHADPTTRKFPRTPASNSAIPPGVVHLSHLYQLATPNGPSAAPKHLCWRPHRTAQHNI